MPFFVLNWVLFSLFCSGNLSATENHEHPRTDMTRVDRSPAIEVAQIFYDLEFLNENYHLSESVAPPTRYIEGRPDVTGSSD